MKQSIYNFIFDHNNGKYIYNSLTGVFAKVNEDFVNILNRISTDDSYKDETETFERMVKSGVIIENDFDELRTYKKDFYQKRESSNSCVFTIAPSFCCNFNCPYCYESKNNYVMSENHVNKLICFIKNSIKGKKACYITWYGGEPLICKEIIYKISQEVICFCKNNNIYYSANIITNASLINNEIIQNLKKMNVNHMQITLDGDRNFHNKKRFFRDGSGSYDVILNHIKLVDDSGIHLSIRINVDKNNEDCVENVFEDLKKLNLKNSNIYFGYIYASTDACASISNSCMTNQQFSFDNLKWNLKLFSKGLFKSMLNIYPNKVNYPCAALSPNSIVVDSKGFFYKCWDDIGNISKSVGSLDCDEKFPLMPSINLGSYLNWSPFEYDECNNCKVLPICGGYCSYLAQKEGHPLCVKWKYILVDYLKQVIDNLNSKGD